jgi:hypothetical protein
MPLRHHAHPVLIATCVLCGLGWAWANGTDASRALATRRWPTVPGQILTAELVSVRAGWGSSRAGSYRLMRQEFHVHYAYTVAGHGYEGWRVSLSSLARQRYPNHATDRYRAGAPVDVHVDPDDPTDAVLESNLPFALLGQTLLGLAVAGGGLVMWQARPRRQRQRQE